MSEEKKKMVTVSRKVVDQMLAAGIYTQETVDKMVEAGYVKEKAAPKEKKSRQTGRAALLDANGKLVFPNVYFRGLTKEGVTPEIIALRETLAKVIAENTILYKPEVETPEANV
jgi:hypothetical protein